MSNVETLTLSGPTYYHNKMVPHFNILNVMTVLGCTGVQNIAQAIVTATNDSNTDTKTENLEVELLKIMQLSKDIIESYGDAYEKYNDSIYSDPGEGIEAVIECTNEDMDAIVEIAVNTRTMLTSLEKW